MKDEYEDDDASVPDPPSPASPVVGDGKGTTIDRRLPIVAALVAVVCAGGYAYTIQSARSSMSQPASAATSLPVAAGDSLRLPAGSPDPSPLPSPSAVPSPRPAAGWTPPPAPPVQPDVSAAAQPRTPSPEEAYAEEERRRILEARRAPSRVTLDGDVLALKTARDTADLQRGSQMQGYLATTSRYEVRRGTAVTATWEVNYDSSMPGGQLVVKVQKNVLDSITHTVVVIPAGTIIKGTTPEEQGRSRGPTFFDEIELPAPDSRKFYIGPNVGAGRAGENGVDVRRNTHAGEDFSRAAFYSVLQAGVNLAGRASTVVDFSPTAQVFQPTRTPTTFYAKIGDTLNVIAARDFSLDRFKEIP
jgi:type IV secretory pathway VirB10-like protein